MITNVNKYKSMLPKLKNNDIKEWSLLIIKTFIFAITTLRPKTL